MIVAPSLASVATSARRRRRCSAVALTVVLGCAAASPADAQMLPSTSPVQAPRAAATIADFIVEASQRFGIPEGWIAAVMRAESAFDPRATSPKGAMGLMQLMPDTWAALRVRLGLGFDPYDPRDNTLAGAGYLRDLYDQFGAGGFLAAYNAGPGRYLDFVTRGRPLPGETRAYVATVSSRIDHGTAAVPSIRAPAAVPSSPPGIFVALIGTATGATTAAPPPSNDRSDASEFDPTRAAANALFVSAPGRTAR
jgi:soluble lytic murein transglycosylase-like protein